MRRTLAALLLAAAAPAPAHELYKHANAPVEARVDDLLRRMTLDEKVALLSGIHDLDLPPNERLGIRELKMTDGPLGVRNDVQATAFPAGIASAASFDPDLLKSLAAAIGDETLALGRDVLLGPCVNIARAPQGGRNFESFGEDPLLAARMARAYVLGLQGRGAMASVKHFALNNQEYERMTIDVRAGERAINELFLPAFEAAVRAGAWTVMAAYNRINGHYAAENAYLLDEVLKKRWGFAGLVVSDWGATHSTAESANAGLDVEMPSGEFLGGGKLQAAVREGRVPLSRVDDMARRVLRAMIGSGAFDRKDADRPAKSVVNSAEHQALALKMAQEGVVVLKNDGGLLPLESAKSLLVTGPNAAEGRAGGGGSSEVTPFYKTSVLQGLQERLGAGTKLVYAQGVKMPGEVAVLDSAWFKTPDGKPGLQAEYFAGLELKGKPAVAAVEPRLDRDWPEGNGPGGGLGSTNFSARWTGRVIVPAGEPARLAVRSDDGFRLWIDERLVLDEWSDRAPTTIVAREELQPGEHALKLEYYQRGGGAMVQLARAVPPKGEIPEAAAAAKAADAAVVVVGFSDGLESEGLDRASLSLPVGQDDLVEAVAAANKNTVVVVEAGSPVLMPWLSKVRAVVMAWYPGQEGGRAAADVLLGRVNASGKTPVSWPKRWEDSPAYGHYPGVNGTVEYAEGLLVGYRHFDTRKVEPLFPFGHGLSYTRFEYSGLAVKTNDASARTADLEVSVTVKNAGKRAGAEVVQLYVHPEKPPVERPEQELKGFARVELAPGESKRVTLPLGADAFSYWDETARGWAAAAGRYELRAGASSRDVRAKAAVVLK